MDFLKYGIENEKSDSRFRSWVARGILTLAKKHADWYEARLNKKQISFPDSPEEDEVMLQKIRERIDEKNQVSG